MNRNSRPISTSSPYFNLTSTHLGGSSYEFQGYRNYSIRPAGLKFNYSQCSLPGLAEYQGAILEYDPDFEDGSITDLEVRGPPLVMARFDDRTASIQIKGVLSSSAAPSDGTNEMSYLGGPVTVTFNGRIDEFRSDKLLPNSNGTPIWNETLGYVFGVDGEEIGNSAPGNSAPGWERTGTGAVAVAAFLVAMFFL
jgi:hypothetical protein